jgi:Phosphoesterase family
VEPRGCRTIWFAGSLAREQGDHRESGEGLVRRPGHHCGHDHGVLHAGGVTGALPDTTSAPSSTGGPLADFQADAAAGQLPAYAFLEPSWGSSGNSQHPNYDVALGEQLLLDTHRALQSSPGWASTLLIITYDEHGGCYDHVAPPSGAAPPDASVLMSPRLDFPTSAQAQGCPIRAWVRSGTIRLMEQLVVEVDVITQRYLRQRGVRRGDLAATAAGALRELALRDGVAALERWHEDHPSYAELADQETAEALAELG